MSDSSMNIHKIIDKLSEKQLIELNQVNDLKKTNFQKVTKLPLMNEVLIGLGAFVSTLFFCLFVGATSFMNIDPKYLFIFWAIIYIGIAISINRLLTGGISHYLQQDQEEFNTGTYWRDTSVCLMIAGKALFLGSCFLFFEAQFYAIHILLIASIFITVMIYPIYHNSVDRFISVGAILILIWAKIFYPSDFFGYHSIESKMTWIHMQFNVNVFLALQFLALGYFTYAKKMMSRLEPIRYAILFSILLYFIFPRWGLMPLPIDVELFKYFISTLVVFSVCYVILALTNFKYHWPEQPVTNILFLTVFLGLFLSPGIIFALTLILYGYGHRENKILILGLLFLPIFLFNYYYNISLTLFYKSLYLMLSGGFLMVFGFYFQYYFAKGKQYVTK